MNGAERHDGHCLCGEVRLVLNGTPLWTATCHCGDCRRATGAASAAYAGYDTTKVEIIGDSYHEHESSPGVFRGYCSTCGSRLTFRGEKWSGQIHIHVGAINDANAFAPRANVYVKEKLSWVQLEEGLPALQTTGTD